MLTYEQDPDVLRWGLELFNGDPFSNCGYGGNGTTTENNSDYYNQHYFNEDHYGRGCSNTENDELIEHDRLIALSLQEELSQLSVVEPSESPHEAVEHSQTSFYPQDWFTQSVGNYNNFGSEGEDEVVHEEANDMGPSSSCSSPGGESYRGEEWSYSLELTDGYALDGEVGKRFDQMVPIPHIPRINGEIPSVDEATLDHQRLLDRLQAYELVELKVQGDGNCQFLALSDQFYRTPEHHKFVRQQVVNQLKCHPEIYEAYVPMAYGDYLKKMSKNGEWGDHVTLQAAADSYGVKIFVVTSFKDTCYIEILPSVERSKRVIFLSFWAEVHYNSIYPEGDMPTFETKKKKKRWWVFQDKHLESPDDFN